MSYLPYVGRNIRPNKKILSNLHAGVKSKQTNMADAILTKDSRLAHEF